MVFRALMYSNMPLFATMVVRRGLSQAIKEGSVAPVQVPEAGMRSDQLDCASSELETLELIPQIPSKGV